MSPKREAEELAEWLKKRVGVISDREWYQSDPEGHLRALATVSVEIDRLSLVLMGDTEVSPQLKHYLVKRSFEKALSFLRRERSLFRLTHRVSLFPSVQGARSSSAPLARLKTDRGIASVSPPLFP